jgi:hypothetical protein
MSYGLGENQAKDIYVCGAVVLKLKYLIQILENWTLRMLVVILLAILTDQRDTGFIVQTIKLSLWKHDTLCSLRMMESMGA